MRPILLITALLLAGIDTFMLMHRRVVPVATASPGGYSPIPPSLSPQEPVIPPPAFQPPEFVAVKVYRTPSESGSVYADVMSHSKGAPFGDGSGRSTNAHETTHGINSEIRNEHVSAGKRINGFYVLQGRGVIVEEPKLKKSDLVKYLPQSIRSYRYSTYITGQREWDDTPTYICDEWVAYINGGMCCVDDVKGGRHKGGWTDGVSGCLDFSIYTVALCMAVKEHDPSYWSGNRQLKSFVVWELGRAAETFSAGRSMPEFKWDKQDALLNHFLTGAEAEPMRRFIREELGGVWLDMKPALSEKYEPWQTLVFPPKVTCVAVPPRR